MLRSCGRALFRAVAERWEAGGIKFNADKGIPSTESALALQQSLGQEAIKLRAKLEEIWVQIQSHLSEVDDPNIAAPGWDLYGENLVFLCNLADAKGFKKITLLLEKVWARTSKGRWTRSRVEFRRAPQSFLCHLTLGGRMGLRRFQMHYAVLPVYC